MSDDENDIHYKKKTKIKTKDLDREQSLKRKVYQKEKEEELRERLKRKYIEHEINSKKETNSKRKLSSNKKDDIKSSKIKHNASVSDNSDEEGSKKIKKSNPHDINNKSDKKFTHNRQFESQNIHIKDESKSKDKRLSNKSAKNYGNPKLPDSRDKKNYRHRSTINWDNHSNKEFASGHNSKPHVKKEEPNFALSGKLTEYTNTYNGVVIKYNEPPEARKPKTRWRLYPFKGDVALEMLQLHRQSAFLFGRDRKIADIPIDHPSCSKQQAILQFRLIEYKRDDGSIGKRVRPYVLDMESTNGTFLNNKKIEPRRYVEMFEKDVLKFGFSSRDYVLLHEKSKDDEPLEDDNGEDAEVEKKD